MHSLRAVAAGLLLCNSELPASGAEGQKSVLLFFDDSRDLQGNIVVDRTVRNFLQEKFSVEVDVRSEYFERPLTSRDELALLSWLKHKYSGIAFDVVGAIGPDSLQFVRAFHDDLLPNAGIVFLGRKATIEALPPGPPVTGILAPEMDTQVDGLFAFIRAVQPDVERVVVVTGTSPVDRQWEAVARRRLGDSAQGVAITYLARLSLEDVSTHLADLPPKTAVLFLTLNEDAVGRRLLKLDVLTDLGQVASAPMYTTSSMFLSTGIVGGALLNQQVMATVFADMIVRILNGATVENIHPREGSLLPMVDWRAVNRWGISESRLPPDTVVMHRQQSVWDLYKWEIIGAITLSSVEAALIVALLVHRRSRRRAEKALQLSTRSLQATIDALDSRIALLDGDGKIIAVNEPNKCADLSIGRDYLEVWKTKVTSVEARQVAEGVRRLIAGKLADFRGIYSLFHGAEKYWFQIRMKRFQIDDVARVVVTHENVTEIKQAHESQQNVTALLLRAQDQERRRIARDVHDVTAQDIATIKAKLLRLQLIQTVDSRAAEALRDTASICDRVITDLRTLSYVLHPPVLDEAGLIPALRWFVRGFVQRSGVEVELNFTEDIGRLETEVEVALYRVVQESLTNVYRHSGSTKAGVKITKVQDAILVRITDEGHGFVVPSSSANTEPATPLGVGILRMQQRLKQLGGEIDIDSSCQGTAVTAKVFIREGAYAACSGS
jgi:signal transduction histidine kinase